MLFKKLCISFNNSKQIPSLFLSQIYGLSFLEVIIFLHSFRIRISCLSSIPRTLDVKSLNYFLFCVEDIGHDYKITSSNLLSAVVFLDKFVKSKKFSDQCVWIFLDIVVIILEYGSQKSILAIRYCLKHVLSICCVIEK